MPKKFHVKLSRPQREQLRGLISAGTATARKLLHTRILLKADEGPGGERWSDPQIIEALEVSDSTVWRVAAMSDSLPNIGPASFLRPHSAPHIIGFYAAGA
jgi:hypothetical protein